MKQLGQDESDKKLTIKATAPHGAAPSVSIQLNLYHF